MQASIDVHIILDEIECNQTALADSFVKLSCPPRTVVNVVEGNMVITDGILACTQPQTKSRAARQSR